MHRIVAHTHHSRLHLCSAVIYMSHVEVFNWIKWSKTLSVVIKDQGHLNCKNQECVAAFWPLTSKKSSNQVIKHTSCRSKILTPLQKSTFKWLPLGYVYCFVICCDLFMQNLQADACIHIIIHHNVVKPIYILWLPKYINFTTVWAPLLCNYK